jgi:hypothetical protein
MKTRRAIRLSLIAALCALLGAATSVGVAWSFGRPARLTRAFRAQPSSVQGAMHDEPGRHVFHMTGMSWQIRYTRGGTTESRSQSTLQSGWPLLALRSECSLSFLKYNTFFVPEDGVSTDGHVRFTLDPTKNRSFNIESWREGIAVPECWRYTHPCLPVLPIWPGFAINTAIYATAWSVLLLAPSPLCRAARYRLRASRGLCPTCGYSLKGAPAGPCPECGARR